MTWTRQQRHKGVALVGAPAVRIELRDDKGEAWRGTFSPIEGHSLDERRTALAELCDSLARMVREGEFDHMLD